MRKTPKVQPLLSRESRFEEPEKRTQKIKPLFLRILERLRPRIRKPKQCHKSNKNNKSIKQNHVANARKRKYSNRVYRAFKHIDIDSVHDEHVKNSLKRIKENNDILRNTDEKTHLCEKELKTVVSLFSLKIHDNKIHDNKEQYKHLANICSAWHAEINLYQEKYYSR